VNLPDDEKRTYENRIVSFFLARLPATQAVMPVAVKPVAKPAN